MSFKEISDKCNIEKLNKIQTLIVDIKGDIQIKELTIESLNANALLLIKELDNPFYDGIFDYLEDYISGIGIEDMVKDFEEEELEEARTNYKTLNHIIEKYIIKPEENPWIKYDKENLVNGYEANYHSYFTSLSTSLSHVISFTVKDFPIKKEIKLIIPDRYKVTIDDITDPNFHYGMYGISGPTIMAGTQVLATLDKYSYNLEDISKTLVDYLRHNTVVQVPL